FLGSFPVPLQHMEWKPDYKGSFCKKEEGDGQWHAKIRLTDPYGNVYDQDDEAGSSSSRQKRARITKNVEEALMGRVLHEFLLWGNCNMTLKNSNAIEDMLEVRVNEMGSNEVLFTSKAWKHAFDINEQIYTKLCHEFYATFGFDEAMADDELITRKAIKFRLCGKAYAMSILDFAKRLGLRNDDDFSADLNISSEETLTLSRSSAKTIRKPVLRVLQKMITYVMTSNNVYFIASFIPFSKRRAFWSLNEDILKITVLNTNTPYPSRKIRRIRACTHQRP
ncbi:hypothetical protein Tco_0872666, partial [Tanacetum coccineum]